MKVFIKDNIRYFLAIFIIFFVFLVNRNFFINQQIDLSCEGEECETYFQENSLSKKNPILFISDSINTEIDFYYRLSFRYFSNNNSRIFVKASTSLDEQQELMILDVLKTDKEKFKEIIFKSNGSFSDVIFEKIDKNDNAEIFISDVQATKLNIKNEKEINNLRPTLNGQTDFFIVDQKQIEDSSFDFDQLKEKGLVLGQVFKPEFEYITSVTLDLIANAKSLNNRQKFTLELRKADFDGEVAEIEKNPLVELDFSLEDLGKYRQEDGRFNFPIFYPLSKDKYYFIGINNKKAEVNDNYYLIIRGSKEGSKYSNGKVVLKRGTQVFPVMGSFYFVTHGLKFSEFKGKKILSNAVLEDIGKGEFKYTYQSKGLILDLADLDFQINKVYFDKSKKAIFGEIAEKNAEFGYKFETIYPFQEIKFRARQVDPNWSQIKITYSLDNQSWFEIPFSVENALQYFEWNFKPEVPNEKIFIKISPIETQEKEKFGIVDLKFEADLITK